MTKIGRNQMCPCNSGHKYKHCCGANSDAVRRGGVQKHIGQLPPQIHEKLRELQRKVDEEREAFGHARRMVTAEIQGYRVVATNSRLEWSRSWKTPIDFLGNYIERVLGADGWGQVEIAKPYDERHPVLQWHHDVCTWQKEHNQKTEAGGIFVGTATGSVMAYYALAYDLWTLDNYTLLQDILVRRLKNADQFQGARYELYVTASIIRAGFDVELENESDPSRTHYELTATHQRTKRKISVEAKSTGRSGMMGKKGDLSSLDGVKAKIYGKLQEALLKQAEYERVIFIDVNMPPYKGQAFQTPWLDEVVSQMKMLEDRQRDDDPYPPAFLFFTNHPYHYVGNDDVESGQVAFFTGINRSDLKVKPEQEKYSDARELANRFEKENPHLSDLVTSVFHYTKVPMKFPEAAA